MECCAFKDYYTGSVCTIDPQWLVFFGDIPDESITSCDIHLPNLVPPGYTGQIWIRRLNDD